MIKPEMNPETSAETNTEVEPSSVPALPPLRISAASCLRSARLFNMLAIATTLLAATLFTIGQLIADKKMAFLPMAMSLPPVMIWLAASIFVYASIAHHPNLTVRHYNQWAGYRYYGIVGFLTILSNDIAQLPTGWLGVWAIMIVALIPWASYDIWRAGKEDWQDMEIEDVHKIGAPE